MKWDQQKAKQMHEAGIGWMEIGKLFGCDYHTVQARLDPDYADHRRRSNNVNKKRRRDAEREWIGSAGLVLSRPSNFSPPLVPVDTRCFTARFCGDPLPGRSALDRRQAAAGE